MTYYGIKTPDTEYRQGYIWWLAQSPERCWTAFFTYPNKDGEENSHRLPIAEAIEAYKAIGYECIEVEVKEKP